MAHIIDVVILTTEEESYVYIEMAIDDKCLTSGRTNTQKDVCPPHRIYQVKPISPPHRIYQVKPISPPHRIYQVKPISKPYINHNGAFLHHVK